MSKDNGAKGEATETPDRQLLFYEQATPVTTDRHGKWSVQLGQDYAFSRSTNSVPLTRVEFSRAQRYSYPPHVNYYTIWNSSGKKSKRSNTHCCSRHHVTVYCWEPPKLSGKKLPTNSLTGTADRPTPSRARSSARTGCRGD